MVTRRILWGAWAAAVSASAVPMTSRGAEENGKTPSVAESLAGEVRAVFERAQKAVVRIEATDRHGKLSGTGFFVDPAGTLYTSYTIGGESTAVEVRFGEKKYPARRLFGDARSGIAVLKVDVETPFIPIGESRSLTVGAPVVVVGYPMDLPLSPSFGCVGGFDLKYLDRYFATRHIRAGVSVQRGQGGAPLLNMRGEAVGVLISSLDQGSACFSLPIEAAEKVHRDFVRAGEIRPGYLGVGVETAATPTEGSTAQVNAVSPGAPGERAGIKPGDVLLEVGSRVISAPEDVLDASFFIAAEDEVKLRVARGGEKLEFTVTAGDRPNPALVHTGDETGALPPVDAADLRGFPVKLDQ